jgi:hypothetical protein
MELQFYSCLASAKKQQLVQRGIRDTIISNIDPIKFSPFDDMFGYSGRIPSSNLLKRILIMENQRKQPFYRLELQRRNGKLLAIDHSFKFCKHLQYAGDSKMFTGLFSATNEYSEIRLNQFVQSTQFSEIKNSFINYCETAKIYGQDVKHIWTDRCCSDRAGLESVLPSLSQNTGKLLPLPDSVRLIKGLEASEICLGAYLDLLNESQDVVYFGLDCEWPTSGNAKCGKIALLQIANASNGHEILIFVTSTWGTSVPSNLQAFLSHKNAVFTGNRILSSDAKYLKEDYNLDLTNERVLKLNVLVKEKGFVNDARISLKNMTEIVLGYTLDKSMSYRMGSWDALLTNRISSTERNKLIEYAARDAWASLMIALKILNPGEDLQGISSGSEFSDSPISPPAAPTICGLTTHLDIFHAMKRITERMPAKHPLLYPFCLEFSRSIFIFDQNDLAAVSEYLSGIGLSFERKWIISPDWIKKRVKARIPGAAELKQRLIILKSKYSQIPNSAGQLFNNVVSKEWNNLMKHVEKSCLSDPEDFNLYVKKRKDRDGLQIYRCLRGTNAVELWHQYLEMRFSSWAAGPDFAQAAMDLLLNRRNCRASVRNRPNFPDFGHYEHYLIDEINDLFTYLYGERRYQHWNPRSETKILRESFGIVPILPLELQEEVTEADVIGYPNSLKRLAILTKCKVPMLGMYGREEKLVFIKAVPKYIFGDSINAEKMANDWNLGRLDIIESTQRQLKRKLNISSLQPLGTNNIWKKSATTLDQYFNIYLKSVQRKNLINQISAVHIMDDDLVELEEFEPEPVGNLNLKAPTLLLDPNMDQYFMNDNVIEIAAHPNSFVGANSTIQHSYVKNAIHDNDPQTKKSKNRKKCKDCYNNFRIYMEESDAIVKSRTCPRPYNAKARCSSVASSTAANYQ